MCANPRFQLTWLVAAWIAGLPVFGGVINYWRFEEGSGALAADETGLANGTLLEFPDTSAGAGDTTDLGWSENVPSSVVPQTGQSNDGSLHFAQYGGTLSLSPASSMNYGPSFTLELSMQLDTIPVFDSPYQLLSFGDADTTMDLWFGQLASGELRFSYTLLDDSGGSAISFFDGVALSTSTWTHVALIKDDSDSSVELFLDGASFESHPYSGSGGDFIFDTSGNYSIVGPIRRYDGYLDEIRISNDALSPNQFLNAVPEPSTFLLTLIGVVALGLLHKQKSSHN